MSAEKRALAIYVNKATDLADSIKRNIRHDGFIDDQTVLALNDFIIAANNVQDLIEILEKHKVVLN